MNDVRARLREQVNIRGLASPFGRMANDALDLIVEQDKRIAELEDLAKGRLEQMESDRKQALKAEFAALQCPPCNGCGERDCICPITY
mgnify:CR=1 FL=1